jgi:glycosyltransferase involved in cell wall biosynthesis
MPSPTVTVIIPTFNWSSVLPFSIGSVLAQTFRDFELLVIGDACTDDSAAVVSGIGDARVRWINLATHVGHQAAPNNAGLGEARGRFVAYLGHDDLWFPHHLDCLVPVVADGADLAFGMTAMVSPDGRILSAPSQSRYAPGLWVPPSSVVHRRDAAAAAGGWRLARQTPVDPEADLWRRMHEAGLRIESVARLTAVKFPALWRKNVYRDRPHHEQAAWSERLTAHHDLEAELLGRMLSESTSRSRSARQLLKSLAGVTADRIRARVLRHAPGLYLLAKNEQRKRHRESKGLSPRK